MFAPLIAGLFALLAAALPLDPSQTSWTAPAHLPAQGVDITAQLWSPAGKAGEGGNPVSGYIKRPSGATGSYVEATRRIYPGVTYSYQIGLGGTQQPTWFMSPETAKAAASWNNGQVGTGHVGDLVRPGLPAVQGYAGAYNNGHPGGGAAGPDGDAGYPVGYTGGSANGGATPGGTGTHGVSAATGGSGAGIRTAAEGCGPGKDGGDPAGAPSPGRCQVALGGVSGAPGDGAIVLVGLPD